MTNSNETMGKKYSIIQLIIVLLVGILIGAGVVFLSSSTLQGFIGRNSFDVPLVGGEQGGQKIEAETESGLRLNNRLEKIQPTVELDYDEELLVR